MGNEILAAGTLAAAKSSSGSFNVILIIVVLFGVLYFVMIRPQRNRQRKVQEQQRQAQPGQRVRTTAGMYATVVAVDGDDVILEVSPGVQVRYVKRAIMQVLPDEDGAHSEPAYETDDDPAYEAPDEADEDAGADDEAAEHETAVHDGEPLAHAGEETSPHATGGSPNGTSAGADESRTQGTL
jgi:preprotein translocase YajC subunit